MVDAKESKGSERPTCSQKRSPSGCTQRTHVLAGSAVEHPVHRSIEKHASGDGACNHGHKGREGNGLHRGVALVR